MIKVLIVDDQTIVRQGLVFLLQREPDLEVVGEASNGIEAREQAVALKPDVVLMDLSMPLCDGIEATRTILKSLPVTKVIVLTTFDDDLLIQDALKAGASGYLLKDSDAQQVAQAIRFSLSGVMTLNTSVLEKISSTFESDDDNPGAKIIEKLSSREVEILRLIGKGKSNREIADQLFLTEGTVKNYVTRILTELDVETRQEAASIAQNFADS